MSALFATMRKPISNCWQRIIEILRITFSDDTFKKDLRKSKPKVFFFELVQKNFK